MWVFWTCLAIVAAIALVAYACAGASANGQRKATQIASEFGTAAVLLVGSPRADGREIRHAVSRLIEAGYRVHVSVMCGRSSPDEFGNDIAHLVARDGVAVLDRWWMWRHPKICVLLANAFALPVIDARTLKLIPRDRRQVLPETPGECDCPIEAVVDRYAEPEVRQAIKERFALGAITGLKRAPGERGPGELYPIRRPPGPGEISPRSG